MYTKQQQTRSRGRKKMAHGTVAEVPERLLQSQMEDLLRVLGIRFWRVPDIFFNWLKWRSNATDSLKRWFLGIFAGWPDVVMLAPISDKYMLACAVEIKTQDKKGRPVGKLHGKQKHWPGNMAVQISRSTAQNEAITKQFLEDVEKCKLIMAKDI